jgi:hypothetical protein
MRRTMGVLIVLDALAAGFLHHRHAAIWLIVGGLLWADVVFVMLVVLYKTRPESGS